MGRFHHPALYIFICILSTPNIRATDAGESTETQYLLGGMQTTW